MRNDDECRLNPSCADFAYKFMLINCCLYMEEHGTQPHHKPHTQLSSYIPCFQFGFFLFFFRMCHAAGRLFPFGFYFVGIFSRKHSLTYANADYAFFSLSYWTVARNPNKTWNYSWYWARWLHSTAYCNSSYGLVGTIMQSATRYAVPHTRSCRGRY